jgi:predicted amidophosphoribosyltransferase
MRPVCSACGQENPEGARFCNACAAPLGAEHATAYIREAEGMFAASV